MKTDSQLQVHNSSVVAKAGLWYTVCNFIFKAMAFLTTPFFARYMSKAELGNFTDFASLASILLVITSLDLAQSIIRSKSDHEQDMDSYIWSILFLSTLWTLLLYAVFLLFPGVFQNLFNLDWKYIHLMFGYLLTAPPYTMLITRQRAFYQYKKFILLTGIMAVSGTLFSFLLVLLSTDKLAGRLIGFYSPYIVFGLLIFLYLAWRGKTIKKKYWRYVIKLCLPMVPHNLSLHVLGVSDVILITRLCGEEYTAFYSIAYSAYHIATVLFDSMNKAWAPWLMDSLHLKKHEQIRKVSTIYILVFIAIILGLLLVSPEIIMVLGGKTYSRSVNCMPPLLASCAFLFIFTMYVNIEFYEKKTGGISLATMVGMAVNVVLNSILLPISPEDSYIIAAYTTLAGYIVIFTIHYFIVKKMKMGHVYNSKFVLLSLLGVLLVSAGTNYLYRWNVVRWTITAFYSGAILYLVYRYRSQIIGVLKRKS